MKGDTVLCLCECIRERERVIISHSHIEGHRLLLSVRQRCEDININRNIYSGVKLAGCFYSKAVTRWQGEDRLEQICKV